jgi:hypothetical protein
VLVAVATAGAVTLHQRARQGATAATATAAARGGATPALLSMSGAPARPRIHWDPITFGAKRRAEMSAYSRRHYGKATVVLHPRVVVLHYTAGGTWRGAWSLFQSDTPNMGEKPGTVAHFIIDKRGVIHQLLPLDIRGRHVVGLNHVAVGIEFVQDAGSGDAWATGQILHRRAQRDAGLALVRWLRARYHIRLANVIGHGMANNSPFFRDLKGWKNDHADWQAPAVRRFRKLLTAAG